MATKTTIAKTEKEEMKKPVIKTVSAKEEPKKPAAKGASAKEEPKKPAAKRTSARKEMKVKAYVEFGGRQVEEKSIIANVKKAWTKSGKKIRDIKTVDLYIKPEESKAYYVINGKESGSVAF